MTTLYPIPWNSWLYLTRDTLDLLGRASELAGHDVQCSEAWRAYLAQKGYWDAYVAYLNGGPWAPVASNPDDPAGQNNHRRAAAVDIVNKADRPFMLAAGFTPDPDEWWHFNNPNWRRMPIVNVADFAGLAATPIPNRTDDDEMLTPEGLAQLRTELDARTARIIDAVQREARARLYRNTATGEVMAVDLHAPAGQRIIRNSTGDPKQFTRLDNPYQLVGDDVAQAVPLDAGEWQTLLQLANGTDPSQQPAKTT